MVSFWRQVKTGAGYGLGGGFGFAIGQALARLLMRSIKLLLVALGISGIGFCSIHDLAKSNNQAKPAQAQHHQQQR